MRQAGRVVAAAHQAMAALIEPGVRTSELDAAVEAVFKMAEAEPLFKGVPGKVPFPAATCISVNEEVVHGIPGSRELRDGDLVSVDTGCRVNGWCGDAAWTYIVGAIDEEKARLVVVGEGVLATAIREMGRATMWSEVAGAMEDYVDGTGFSLVESFVGHGIGKEMHESPQVPNYLSQQLKRHDFRLEPGLVLAVEPMLNAGGKTVRILNDHWTVATTDGRPSVHFEHTIAITANGPEILTTGVGQLA